MKRAVVNLISLVILVLLFLSSCSPVDKNYAASSEKTDSVVSTVKKATKNVPRPRIMSDDKVMGKYLDLSIFDEENYSKVYLGKKFIFNVTFANDEFTVPTNLTVMNKKGWNLVETSTYNEDSIVYACESVDAVFENQEGAKISAVFYNSSNSSVKLGKCNIVKFKIENDFYINHEKYNDFNVNGINNKMAITDIIDTLGMPSHFYGSAPDNYFLDYFITEKDRRNGITVYINPADDLVTAIEFSFYK